MKNKYVNKTHELIYDFIQCAKYVCGIFEDMYTESVIPLRAYTMKLIPKSDTIDGILYNFHGIGCYFEFNGGAIDVDFGPDGRHDGFDKDRLKFYLSEMPLNKKEYYKSILEEDKLTREFNYLIKGDIIGKLEGEVRGSHLYYLK